jgi:6-phosphogluconolactonase (cycloisomerase 2 family)
LSGVAAGALVLALSVGVAQAVPGSLNFVEQDVDGVGGVDGISNTLDLAVSPDGAHVYATGFFDNSVATFARDPASGALSFVEQDVDGAMGVDGINSPRGVAVSPDGENVYVTGLQDDAVAVFSRDGTTGALTFVEREMDGVGGVDGLDLPTGVVVAPDGGHVYVAGQDDDAVVAFDRDSGTGALTFASLDQDQVNSVFGINGASGVEVSPDGDFVYVTGRVDDTIATFARNATTGDLTYNEFDKDGVGGVDGLDGAFDVAASPDNAHVYVTGSVDDAVATFSRNPAMGQLTFVEQDKDGVNGVDGIDFPQGVALSPDGMYAYVTGDGDDDAVATFSRNPATGALTFVEQDRNGVAGVAGIDGAAGVAASPDGGHVYVSGATDSAVATFFRGDPPSDAGSGADADPPETTITKGPKKKTKKRKAKFEFSSDEQGSTFQCKLDKGGFEPCDPAETFKVKRKKHTLEVRAVDPAGNVDPTPAQLKWKVKRKR